MHLLFGPIATATLIISSLALGAAIDVTKSHFVKPVRIISASAAEAHVSYQLACGETVRGLVLKESRESLALGIIVDRTDKICSSLPAAVTTKIALKTPRRLRSLALGDDKRILLGPANDLVISEAGLSVSWQDSCRPTVGIVLGVADGRTSPEKAAKTNEETSVQTAQLLDSSGGKPGPCEGGVRRASIKSLDLSLRKFKLPSKPGRLSDLYLTRIVAPEKITVAKSGVVHVAWLKSCMEKPMGLLFSGARGHQVGIVSMIAPNTSCKGRPKRDLDHYVLRGLVLPSSANTLVPITKDRAVSLTRGLSQESVYLPISEVELSRRGQGDRIYATAASPCSGASGLVLGLDVYGNLSAALLAKDASAICRVSDKTSKLRVEAPLVVPEAGPAPRIFNLKVFGTAAS